MKSGVALVIMHPVMVTVVPTRACQFCDSSRASIRSPAAWAAGIRSAVKSKTHFHNIEFGMAVLRNDWLQLVA